MNATAAQDEYVIQRIDDHWVKLVAPVSQYALSFFSGTLLMLFALAAHGASPILSYGAFVIGMAVILIVHHRFFAFVLSEVAEAVFLTNHRVIFFEQRLFALDELREISFEKAKTVTAKKEGLLQNLFNYGTLNFEIGGIIEYVPHPTVLAHRIQEIIRSNR